MEKLLANRLHIEERVFQELLKSCPSVVNSIGALRITLSDTPAILFFVAILICRVEERPSIF